MPPKKGKVVKRKREELRAGPSKKPRTDDDELEVDDEEVMDLTKRYHQMIRTSEKRYRTYTRYNFRESSLTPRRIMDKLKIVYDREATYNGQGSIFKANIRAGLILMDRVTSQLFWYYPGRQTTLNEKPIIIRTKKDLDRALNQLSRQDFREKLLQYAPNSRFVFFQATNIEIMVTPIKGLPLRGDLRPNDFPDWLVKNRDVYCFIKSVNGKCLLRDGLCLFRCLAVFFANNNKQACETEAKRLAKIYCNEHGLEFTKFPGVTMAELELVENCFDVGIKVYSLSEGVNKCLCRVPLEAKKNGVCQVLTLQSKHFCLIKPGQEERFLGGFQCKKCTKLETTKRDCNRHEAKCKGAESKVVVKTGTYIQRGSLQSQLKKVGVLFRNVRDVFQRYFVVYDAESCMEKTADDMFSSKTEYEYRHKALVVCAATNIPGEKAKIFINKHEPHQPDKYLRDFFDQVETWRLIARDDNYQRAQYIFDYLDTNIRTLEDKPERFGYMRRLQLLKIKLGKQLETINVLSFNGRSYDIPLMREHLLPLFHQFGNGDELETEGVQKKKKKKWKSGVRFMVKQGASRYDAVLGNKIRLLDVLNYLGGQVVTLRSFVSNFAKDQQEKVDKAWFPYNVLKKIETLDDLKEFGLPVVADFRSDMSQGNTLGKNEREIKQNYNEFVKLWCEHGCSNLYDWILIYVKIDCLCMIPAIQNLQNQWYEREIDVFTSHCTIQSAMVPYLMSTIEDRNLYFVVPDETTLELLREKGIVGGLAEIFTRHQEAGLTPIQHGSEILTQTIESHDSNSQYLAALGSEMPVGPYLVRKSEDSFKPRLGGDKRATSAIQWLDYEAYKSGHSIQHTLNGNEPVLWCSGKLMRPDGYYVDSNNCTTIYEYDGCDSHACDICKKSNLGEEVSPVTGKTYNEMKSATKQRNEIWKIHYSRLIVKQECEFKKELDTGGELKDFVETWMIGPNRYGHNTRELSEVSMVKKLKSGEIFGFALVDVECDASHADYEKLKMFPPIIRPMNIDPSMIPKDILKRGEENGTIFDKPRKNLVACMTGKQVLIYTPLLKYLCEIEVKLTKVYQVIQFQANHFPFKKFEKMVANDRREGDRTGNVVKTNLAKHMGASAWGKFAFNPGKRNTYRIVNNEELSKALNGPLYMNHLELGDDYAEIQLRQKNIKYDLPVQIAVAVYGAAKLNLLKFVHSYILKYFDHTKLSICATDTDSVLISWASSKPEVELVHPHLRDEYEREKYNFVVDYRTPQAESHTKRQPGLFKIEVSAKKFIGLSAKCYIMVDETEETIKHAAKGVSSKTNDHILRFKTFKAALYDGVPVEAFNKSFRTIPNKPEVYTTNARRIGLQPFYIKRKLIEPDYIFSEPLDESKEVIDLI